MAAQKQHKAELIAIYRLEFYKKQKKWKLSTDARKEEELRKLHTMAPMKNSRMLNETYCIETNVDDSANILNDAFLKDESDKESPVLPATRPTLHTQWLEPINACQECQHTDVKPPNPWADYVDDGRAGDSGPVDKCSGDGNEFEGFDGWVEGMVWTNSSMAHPACTGDVAAPLHILGAGSPGPLAAAADDLLYHQLGRRDQLIPWPDDQIWIPDTWREEEMLVESLESVDEFMIGAHSAPHSSEVELCAPADGDGAELDASRGSLARMSGAALSAAVRRHTGSLRCLLREAGQRRKYRSTLSLDVCAPDHFGLAPRDFFSTDYSYELYPTRDVPATPLDPTYLCNDGFIPLPSIKQCDEGITPMFHPSQCNNGFTPLSFADQLRDGFTPLPPANQLSDDFNSMPPGNRFKNSLAALPAANYYKYDCLALPQANQCNDGLTPPPPTNQRKDSFAPVSPANLYRNGFLAGSHRNKIPLCSVGRGRGRLQGDGGVQA